MECNISVPFQADAEAHLLLIVEVLPDWAQLVAIKRGRFLKVDKNSDLTAVINRLNKLVRDSS